MSNNNDKPRIRISGLDGLFLAMFIIAKVSGLINISWWWILLVLLI